MAGASHPAIVAGVFLLLGAQTSASALAVMCFNAVCSAATGVIVYELGKQIHSERAGWFAGWIWEVSPYVAILPYVLWDTALSALCFSGALLLTLQLRAENKARDWIFCGAIWGVTALVNPALLTPLPVLAWLLSEGGRKLRLVGAMAAVTIVVIMPWTVRNYAVFHEIVPVRRNGLAEVYFANGGFENHPLGPSMEYQNLGEAAFTAQMGHRAIEYVRTHPVKFIRDSLWRVLLFWIYPVNFWPLSVLIDVGALVGLVVLFKKSSPFDYASWCGVGRVSVDLLRVASRFQIPASDRSCALRTCRGGLLPTRPTKV